MKIEEIRQRAKRKLSADDYRKMSVSEIAQIRMDVKRLLKELDALITRQEQPNEPLTGPLKIGDSVHGMKIIGLDALVGTITLSGWKPFHRKPEQEG